MCMLCVEIEKGKMKPSEIARAYREAPEAETSHWSTIMRKINEHSDIKEVAEEMSKQRQEAKLRCGFCSDTN